MTAVPDRVVVVGASVAGVAVARALRAEGYEREVVLIGAEQDWPYDKPPLSKEVLCADPAMVRTSLLTPEQAEELALDVRLGLAAAELDVAAREVVLADGRRLGFGACVIATGALAAALAVAVAARGARAAHASRLRGDPGGLRRPRAGRRRRRRVHRRRGRVVGADARPRGHGLDPLAAPMERLVGIEAARLFTDLAARHGADLRLGHGVHAIDGQAGALTITLSDGSTVEAATAVIGIGVLPNDGWLASSGLLLDNGVVCDELCRAEGAEDVYAAGDIARWHHPEQAEPVRVEHWTNAVDQAGTVAHNIARPDERKPYAPVPYVWTDQYGWKFQIAGHPERAARHEVVGDLAGDRPRAALVYEDAGGRLMGALTLNWPRALVALRRGIADGTGAAEAARALGDGSAAAAATT